MMEKTTIGGTTYDSIGSSSSNLLLKCNGTARIQWGGQLKTIEGLDTRPTTDRIKETLFNILNPYKKLMKI